MTATSVAAFSAQKWTLKEKGKKKQMEGMTGISTQEEDNWEETKHTAGENNVIETIT